MRNICFSSTVAGTVEEFDRDSYVDGLVKTLADTGVTRGDITLTVESASVKVEVLIATTTDLQAENVIATLSVHAGQPTPQALSEFSQRLGVVIQSTGAIAQTFTLSMVWLPPSMPPPSSRSTSPPTFPLSTPSPVLRNSTDQSNTRASNGADPSLIIVAVCVATALALLFLFILRRRQQQRGLFSTRAPKPSQFSSIDQPSKPPPLWAMADYASPNSSTTESRIGHSSVPVPALASPGLSDKDANSAVHASRYGGEGFLDSTAGIAPAPLLNDIGVSSAPAAEDSPRAQVEAHTQAPTMPAATATAPGMSEPAIELSRVTSEDTPHVEIDISLPQGDIDADLREAGELSPLVHSGEPLNLSAPGEISAAPAHAPAAVSNECPQVSTPLASSSMQRLHADSTNAAMDADSSEQVADVHLCDEAADPDDDDRSSALRI